MEFTFSIDCFFVARLVLFEITISAIIKTCSHLLFVNRLFAPNAVNRFLRVSVLIKLQLMAFFTIMCFLSEEFKQFGLREITFKFYFKLVIVFDLPFSINYKRLFFFFFSKSVELILLIVRVFK